jgi:hypothetical protein
VFSCTRFHHSPGIRFCAVCHSVDPFSFYLTKLARGFCKAQPSMWLTHSQSSSSDRCLGANTLSVYTGLLQIVMTILSEKFVLLVYSSRLSASFISFVLPFCVFLLSFLCFTCTHTTVHVFLEGRSPFCPACVGSLYCQVNLTNQGRALDWMNTQQ